MENPTSPQLRCPRDNQTTAEDKFPADITIVTGFQAVVRHSEIFGWKKQLTENSWNTSTLLFFGGRRETFPVWASSLMLY